MWNSTVKKSQERFADENQWLGSFLYRVLVHCPQCDQCAEITNSPQRLLCINCGYSKKNVRWDVLGGPVSSNNSKSLWLQTPCCGKVLWAFNLEHLAYLESYISADHRERKQTPNGWSNSSLASRLPKWMIAAKHRKEVLQAILKLREMA